MSMRQSSTASVSRKQILMKTSEMDGFRSTETDQFFFFFFFFAFDDTYCISNFVSFKIYYSTIYKKCTLEKKIFFTSLSHHHFCQFCVAMNMILEKFYCLMMSAQVFFYFTKVLLIHASDLISDLKLNRGC